MHALRLTVPLAALLLAACGGKHVPIGSVSSQLEPTANPEALDCALVAGSIEVVPATGTTIDVEAEVLVREERVQEFADSSLEFADHVTVTERDGVFTVRSAHAGDADEDDWQLRLRVAIPAGLAVRASLDAGLVDVAHDTLASLDADVGAGQVRAVADRISGAVAANVSAGQVTIEVRERAPTELRAGVSAGQVSLALPEDTGGRFELKTDVGGIVLPAWLDLTIDRELTGAAATGTVGQGDGRFRVDVSSGEIRVR